MEWLISGVVVVALIISIKAMGSGKKQFDIRASTDRSISYLNTLPIEARAEAASLMGELIGQFMSEGAKYSEAFAECMRAKQQIMFRLKLKNHHHPEFSVFQVIEDVYFSLGNPDRVFSKTYSLDQVTTFVKSNSNNPNHHLNVTLLQGIAQMKGA